MAVREDIAKEFDYSRQKAKESVGAGVQQKRDAITRRAAQMGGGPGGAMIKAEQQAIDSGDKQLADANAQIDSAQRGEMRRIGEIEEGRAYQTKEREAGQTFQSTEAGTQRNWQSGEANTQRNWMTGEREAGQTFATGEREAGQLFSTSERQDSQRWQTGEREGSQLFSREERKQGQSFAHEEAIYGREWQGNQNAEQRGLDQFNANRQFDFAKGEADWQHGVDKFNMDLATKMANEKDMLEGMFGGAGKGTNGAEKGVYGLYPYLGSQAKKKLGGRI